ncbi:helix-turn-helix transcriptional regulator [Mycolicibacterium mengxianglii]|uniref:helix-turn-helix transcriptional regulator n=1 Tax=Mycolicibacterium mengxianglii TaxID=2736649 RepID=UPI0018EEF02E|nr:helix-turn-helix transcriptional regulator [Mycolicibacterium mengxianglii]
MRTDRYLPHPERSGIDSSDPTLIQKYLDQAYSARFSITRAHHTDEPCLCTHSRFDVGRYAIEEIRHHGEVRLHADAVPSVVAVSALSGRVESEYGALKGAAGPGEWVLASTGGDGVRLRLANAHLRSVVLNRSLLAEVAAIGTGEPSQPVQFTGLMPTSVAMAGTLTAAERFVHQVLSTAESSDNPILLGSAGRMLAGAVLASFPSDVAPDVLDDEPGDDHPALLRQAVEFIEANAARDIGVVDIAAAVYLTPRTVQYMFRRHLDTTPTAYLRDVRMQRARAELIAADRGVTTVAATAARWGFAHTGRFAVLYRHTFGESPHQTLRQ